MTTIPLPVDLDLLEQIHAVALGQASWAEVLECLRVAFRAELSSLRLYALGSAQTRTLASVGVDGRPWHLYAGHFAAIDPFAAAMRSGTMPAGTVMHGQLLVPDREFCASEFFNDWFRPNGLRHAAGAYVRAGDGGYLQLGLPRAAAPGPYTADEVARLQRYFNHIRRALLIQQELQARRRAPDFDRVANTFGLSPAETRLIAGLAETGSLKRFAQRADRSYYTLRAQLLSVFRKTGTGSQIELMRLIHQGRDGV